VDRSPRILLGVCGGIAAYKSAELVRELQRAGAEVRVIMTKAAEAFIQPLTFASLTGHKVYTSLWTDSEPSEDGSRAIEHIAQAQWADLLLVAPVTANTLAKFCHGFADDFLSATYLATTAPIALAPSMNVNMWDHPATRANLSQLRHRGHRVISPESGYLACGMTGDGRLADTAEIVRTALDCLHQPLDLLGETVLITAGGTREPIDTVRYLGNRSSGKMGYALAADAARRGAHVILISAATAISPPGQCDFIAVDTASEMHAAVLQYLPQSTIVIKAAAVADFHVRTPSDTKLERSHRLTLDLEPTQDIVRSVVEHRNPGTLVIAFAAEMGMNLERAHEKLVRKGADAIVVNDISQKNLGFDSDRNAVIFLTPTISIEIEEASKDQIAKSILNEISTLRMAKLPQESQLFASRP